MKKILSIVLLLIIILFAWGFWYKSYMQNRVLLSAPSIEHRTNNSVTFEYTTPDKEVASIYFSTNPQALSNVRQDNFATQKHLIVLKNLHRCTTYFYKVESPSLPVENKTIKSFKTLCN